MQDNPADTTPKFQLSLPHDKREAPDAQWEIARKRDAVFRPLLIKGTLSATDVADACAALQISRPSFYRLFEVYRANPTVGALVTKRPGRPIGARVLASGAENLIMKTIKTYFLTEQKLRISKLMRFMTQEAAKAGIACPSRKTVEVRIREIDLRTVIKKREGLKAANDKTRPVVGSLEAAYPLQIVQVDHTRADIFVVDERNRLPIQRPWLTLLIDIATRMVTGYYLSLEAPSVTSVALALQHAVLPKEESLAAHGITAPWPVHGLPDILHMDNGAEFHSKALSHGARAYGIDLCYRPAATPHYGGHIERLIGTMMGEMHMLPGTTFSGIDERGAYDPEQHATMTLSELDQWFAIQIVGQYHQQIHNSLKRPPIAVWKELINGRPMPVRHPNDIQQFVYDFLPFEERRIGRDGISLFGIKYWDDVLAMWAGRSTTKMRVKYDPRNLSCVYLEDIDGFFWPIRYRDLRRPPVTFWEHARARKALREQGRSELDEQMIFDAIAAQQVLIEDASEKTKAARRNRQRGLQAMRATIRPTQITTIEPKTSGQGVEAPVVPYEIEDWS